MRTVSDDGISVPDQRAATASRWCCRTSASRVTPRSSSAASHMRASVYSRCSPVALIGRCVPALRRTGATLCSRENRNSFTASRSTGLATLVKSIRALLVVRGKMPRKSHTSSANRGPRLPVPWQADSGSTHASAPGAGPLAAGRPGRAGHRGASGELRREQQPGAAAFGDGLRGGDLRGREPVADAGGDPPVRRPVAQLPLRGGVFLPLGLGERQERQDLGQVPGGEHGVRAFQAAPHRDRAGLALARRTGCHGSRGRRRGTRRCRPTARPAPGRAAGPARRRRAGRRRRRRRPGAAARRPCACRSPSSTACSWTSRCAPMSA